MMGSVAGERQVPRLTADPERQPGQINRRRNGLGPKLDRMHVQVRPGFVTVKPVLLNQATGKLGETVAVQVAMEDWTEDDCY